MREWLQGAGLGLALMIISGFFGYKAWQDIREHVRDHQKNHLSQGWWGGISALSLIWTELMIGKGYRPRLIPALIIFLIGTAAVVITTVRFFASLF